MYFSNDENYDGDWVNDLRCGNGTYHFADGGSYAGEFVADKFHGNGTAYFSDGTKFSGAWENGVAKGKEAE